MFYQSAVDRELFCVAGPGDMALSEDKQADKEKKQPETRPFSVWRPLEEGKRRKDED